jgi:predicted TIM-barrel fold metal-dependent hydrolase
MHKRVLTLAVLAFAATLGAQQSQDTAGKQPSTAQAAPALSPLVDVHTHPEPSDSQASVRAALGALSRENAAKIIFMPPPFTSDDPKRYDAELLLPAVKGHEDKLAVLGGGGSLNAMIQDSVRSGDAGPAVRRKFKERAEELLREGAAGFGEMAAEHFYRGGTTYQYAPPDHPLFLLLANIAAAHGVPIDIHMEAVPEEMPLPPSLKSPPNRPQLQANIAAFERLLAHNPHAPILWAHIGTDYTGYRTPALCRRLLQRHSNLYMEIKIDPQNPGVNPLLADGRIKPDWLKLFQDFPDRFVVGSDQHYPEPKSGPQRWEAVVSLLNQLPGDLRRKIGTQNALRLYSGAQSK